MTTLAVSMVVQSTALEKRLCFHMVQMISVPPSAPLMDVNVDVKHQHPLKVDVPKLTIRDTDCTDTKLVCL